jgi:hypothetical protein
VTREADHPNNYVVTLPVGTAATVDTMTDADTADFTLPGGHGLSTGTYDIHWGDGSVRYGCTGTVTGDTMSVDGTGSGDAFPAASTAVVITAPVDINTTIDGDNSKLIALCAEYTSNASTAWSHVSFRDSTPTEVCEFDLKANSPRVCDIEGGDTNQFAGNVIASAKASNGSATEECTLKIMSLEDSTP